ncbi:MAG TPA: imidazolonepropionase, partial [Thermoanaerobaculia bacterium]
MLLIHNLAEVATPQGTSPHRGPEQGKVLRLRGAEVVCRDGKIEFAGSPEERVRLFGELPDAERLDGRGGTLIPGFVDPHTHLPWAGTREEEFMARLAGTTYQEIAAKGGGILSTVASTRRASEEELA